MLKKNHHDKKKGVEYFFVSLREELKLRLYI